MKLKMMLAALTVLTAIAAANAQQPTQLEPSYDVALQVLVGSNEGTGSEIPHTLAPVAKRIRESFGLTNYRLATSFVGRIANHGSFEYKSTSNISGQESREAQQTFLDWSLRDLRTMTAADGQIGFQAEGFRFGARVPVAINSSPDAAGKPAIAYSYEPIGIGLTRVGVKNGSPTLIGTLNLPGTSGTVFLIMTVKAADQ